MTSPASFESAYSRAREREGRVLADDVVRRLPFLERGPHAAEWRQRADSSDRLLRYLAHRGRPLIVHDYGCGNGWLTARLVTIENVTATGIDVGAAELAQAARVFADRPRLDFVRGDLADAADLGHAAAEA